jgi:uncharacterized protein (TIGR02466 family)
MGSEPLPPNDYQFRSQLAQAAQCLNRGDADGAKAVLIPLLTTAPTDPLLHYLLGGTAKLEGDLPSAEASYRTSLATNPKQPQVEKSLGIVLRDQGLFDDAVEAFRRAAELEPKSVEGWVNLGLTALQAEQAGDAESAFRKVLHIVPNHPRALTGIGQAEQIRADHASALTYFAKAKQADPKSWRTLSAEAVSFLALGQNDDAAVCLATARALEPRAPGLYQLSGRTSFAQSAFDEALEFFRHAVKLAPDQNIHHRDLNQLLYMMGKTDEFLESYHKILAQAPDHPQLLCGLSAFAHLTDHPEMALKPLQSSVNRGQKDPAVLDALGLTLARMGRPGEALPLHEQALAQSPNHKVLLQNYVQSLLRAHEFIKARDAADLAVNADPLDQMSRAYYVTTLQCLGDDSAEGLFDPEQFVNAQQIETPEGYQSLQAFNDVLYKDLRTLHKMNVEPFDQSLRGGTQVELSRTIDPPSTIDRLKKALEQNVAKFIDGLPDNSAHPFLSRKSSRFRFSGMWSVRLRRQGHHAIHAHPEGWISSAYYAHLPAATSQNQDKQGWYYFGPPAIKEIEGLVKPHYVKPRVGALFLFPSYYWHGTVPFDSDDERVTVAFDAVPLQ